jgi:hypothetical protein
MQRNVLYQIRSAIRDEAYDATIHAVEQMAEDDLDIIDVETAALNGQLFKQEKDDLRGTRYTIHGTAMDGSSRVAIVGRFTASGRFLVITVYRIGDQ